jgi:hypothetical protein
MMISFPFSLLQQGKEIYKEVIFSKGDRGIQGFIDKLLVKT